jgi:hypothetical protein
VGLSLQTTCNIIVMYSIIQYVIVTLGEDNMIRTDWTKIHYTRGAFESFDFVFDMHLMFVIIGNINNLSVCRILINAFSLINAAKIRIQQLRPNDWDQFLQRITLLQ